MASNYTGTLTIKSTGRYARGYVEAWVHSETDTTATIYWRILCQQKSAALYGQEAYGYVDGSYVGYCSGHIDSSSSDWKNVCSTSGYTTVNKTTVGRNVPVSIDTRVTPIDGYGSVTTGWASAAVNVWVGAKTSYAVKYNANGGSGAPDAQVKWHGESLALSSTKPSRTGYSFQGWGTSASDTSVDYAAGSNYTANAAITLYAIWKANTYTVTFSANGGSGAPSSVTKTYGVTLTLPTTKPTRTNYNFLGWATSASATTAQYSAGDSFTTNAATTLYAVWELAYIPPTIYNLAVNRCDSLGDHDDYGTYALVTFDWETCQLIGANEVASISIVCNGTTTTLTPGGTSGSVSQVVGGSLSIESQYAITVTVTDTIQSGSTSRSAVLPKASFPIDYKAGGTGAAFGKPAEKDGLEVDWDVWLNKKIYVQPETVGVANLLSGGKAELTTTRFIEVRTKEALQDHIGKTITVSFDMRILSGGTSRPIQVYPYQNNGVSILDTITFTPTAEWRRFSFVTTAYDWGIADSSYTTGGIGFYDHTGENSYAIRRVKIELGSVPTDWTPALLDMYPIGAVYISYVSTSPAELFGGTWTAIKGRFPYFNAGTGTGGSNTHTLTVAQMPSHNHPGGNQYIRSTGTAAGTVNSSHGYIYHYAWMDGNSVASQGGGGSHNNMPAYQTLYAWRRTA